ncbi:unnamed protein product [Nezara viridula]|uniref:Uncharacterized protein n=1 Tax=Nezara viridula TaxID=85310 RepID=A0A9P0EFX7_NEZVI|nr:unnamed protein product [Nezara viridula]
MRGVSSGVSPVVGGFLHLSQDLLGRMVSSEPIQKYFHVEDEPFARYVEGGVIIGDRFPDLGGKRLSSPLMEAIERIYLAVIFAGARRESEHPRAYSGRSFFFPEVEGPGGVRVDEYPRQYPTIP